MKTLILVSVATFFLSLAPVNYEHVTNTLWKIKENNNNTCIILKNDHTLWHYTVVNKVIKDSVYVSKWSMEGNIILFTWDTKDIAIMSKSAKTPLNFSESYEIITFNSKKLVLRNTATGYKGKYTIYK